MTGTAGSEPHTASVRAAANDFSAPRYAHYVLGVLFVVMVLNFIDRSILSILAQDIKSSLHLADQQLGFLYGTAFAIFYSLFGLPLGRLADRWYRGRLIALGLIVWSAMTVLSGFANRFSELAIARIGVGIGEASASPAVYSLLADWFPARLRARVLSLYHSGVFIGAGVSLPLGGWLTHTWNNAYINGGAPLGLVGWQAAFIAVGLPGLAVAAWVLTLREPTRGLADGAALPVVRQGAWRAFVLDVAAILPPFTLWSVARFPGALRYNLFLLGGTAALAKLMADLSGDQAQWLCMGFGIYAVASWMQMLYATDRPTYTLIFGTPAVLLALIGFGVIGYASYALFFWAPPYVMRTFGVGGDIVGLMLGVPGGLAAAAGCIVGGTLSDRWKRRDPRGRLFVSMLAVTLPIPLVIAILNATEVTTIYLLNPLERFASYLYIGSAAAMIQDCVLPRMRGTAGAVYLLALSLIGQALGPYCTGKVATLASSLRVGYASILVVMPIALVLLWLASRQIETAENTKVVRARVAGEPA